MKKLLAVPLVLMGLTGCAGVAFMGQGVPQGFIYANAQTPNHATENNIGKKKGESCAVSVLGIITTGNSSIRAAAYNGEIVEISAVDSSIKNVLGIWAKYCTVVSGTG